MINGHPDDIDIKILNLLQEDGRMDVARIARKVHKSPPPVHDRIHRLQQLGFIKGYTAIIDRGLAGKPVFVVAMVKLEKQTKALLAQFVASVKEMEEIQFCLQVSGKWDFMIHVAVATPDDYYKFLMERLCSNKNVSYVESSFVLQEHKAFAPLRL
jgi:Lrp/AsnC family leucine-responsive transcriptional regulator